MSSPPGQAGRSARQYRGEAAYLSGLSGEQIVARDYDRRGYKAARSRWRSPAGEIDLILHRGGQVIFVEVKSGRSHDQAALRLSPRQLRRIEASARLYLASLPQGTLTDCRIDLALVDAAGRVAIIENASQL